MGSAVPRGEPRRKKAEDTRDRILAAAERVFTERGFDAATTREIAALSRTNVATPYAYFAGKDALYAAVIERAVAPLIDLVAAFEEEGDQERAARHTIQSVLDRLAKHPGTTRLIYREVVSDGPLAEQLNRTLFTPLLGHVVAQLRSRGNVERAMEPFLASLYVHLSFSHVALAPLLSRVFETDMLSPENLERQVRLIAAAGLRVVDDFADGTPGGDG